MKDEMELVQEMEVVENRNSELYVEKLDKILDMKSTAIHSLRSELSSFLHCRALS
jgi:hypothetical protein